MKKKVPREGDLIICETASSTWNYHLRQIGPEGPMYGGGAGNALCGQKLGWDTLIPLDQYGSPPDHIPIHWCSECAELAKKIKGKRKRR